MTTRNVNSSCDVIWVSRQDNTAIDALFKSSVDAVASVPGAFDVLVASGAMWLAARSGYATQVGDRSGNYLYPDGASYSDVVQCQWSKDLSSPAGVFSMQVKPRVDWDRYIKPGDLLVIFMDDDHRYGVDTRTDGTLITVGIVDRASRSTTVDGNGATVEMVTINGRDLGVIFQETQTVFDPTLAVLDQEMFNAEYITQTSQEQVVALSPVEIIYRLLDLIYNQNATGSKLVGAQWALPSAPLDASGRPVSLLSLLNVTEFTQRPMFGYAITQPFGVAQAGNVWTLLESYANRTVNEFFIDIRDVDAANMESIRFQSNQAFAIVAEDDVDRQDAAADVLRDTKVFNQSNLDPGKFENVQLTASYNFDKPMPVPALVHRQMPYDLDAFMNLPCIDVDHTEVFDFDIGMASHEVSNYFEMHFPDIPEVNQELMWGIKLNMRSLARFGIRRMEAETRFPFASSQLSNDFARGGAADFTQSFAVYVGLLSTWYATQETLYNGSMSCRFMPKIRVGTRIRFRRVDGVYFHFYVQAVNHIFSVQPGASRTTLTIVRGIREDGTGLANNLIWRPSLDDDGEQIPETLLKYVRVKRIGVDSK